MGHFFVRDMVESFELQVPFVATADNVAEFLTIFHHGTLENYGQFYLAV